MDRQARHTLHRSKNAAAVWYGAPVQLLFIGHGDTSYQGSCACGHLMWLHSLASTYVYVFIADVAFDESE